MAAAPQPAPPAPAPPLDGAQRAIGTVALSLAVFMNVLDTSIANVSLPAIAGNLGVSPTQGTWVITSFAVANAIAVPLTGWLTQRFGQVRLFVTAVLLFVVASWLCGLAPNIESLILFRVVQGAVAGPLIPLSQTLLLASYPKALAGLALSLWAMTTLVAPVLGPVLGGWITDNFSWPWIFYINIPVGFASIALTWSLYRSRESPIRRLPIDKVGLALLIVWVGAMQIMLDKGKELDWFESGEIVVLACVAGVGFVAFLVWELTDAHPVVDLRFFANRNFVVGTVVVSLGYGAFFGNVVLLPLWLQQWMGYTATWAGLLTAPVGILAIILSPIVGRSVVRLDPRRLVTVSFLVFGVVLWMRSRFTTDVDPLTILIPVFLQGIAMATFFIPLVTLTLADVPPERMAAASGASNFVRITAGAIGTSITTTLWESRASLHHAEIASQLTPGNAALQQALAGLDAQGIDRQAGIALVDRLVNQQAYTMSADDIFLASAVLFVVMLPLVWFTRPLRTRAVPAAPADAGAH